MAAPIGSPINAARRRQRSKPRAGYGNVWDGCVKLSDQAGFTWDAGAAWVAWDAARDAAKTANDAAIAAGMAAAIAAGVPLYIGNLGAKGVFWTSAFVAVPDGLWIRADGPRQTKWFAEPLSSASAGIKQSPQCNLRLGNKCRLWNFSRVIVGASARVGLPETHHIVTNNGYSTTPYQGLDVEGIHAVGGASAAFLFYFTDRVHTSATEASNSLADSFNCNMGITNLDANNHHAYACGDDGFSTINATAAYIDTVRVNYLQVFDSKVTGRGLAWVGGKNLHARNLYIKRPMNQAVLVVKDGATPVGVKGWSVTDVRIYGTIAGQALFEVVGVAGFAADGSNLGIEDGFILRGKGVSGSGGRGLNLGKYVKNLYADIDVSMVSVGVSLASSFNNIEVVGRITKCSGAPITSTGGAFTGNEASFHGGFLLLHDLVFDSVNYSTFGDLISLRGTDVEATTPQYAALSQFEIVNVAHTLGTHPTTGVAVPNTQLEFFLDLIDTTPARTLRRVNLTTDSGKGHRQNGWTVVTA